VELDAPARAIDLGCGPGNSTAVLAARWPGAELSGLDSSAEMLAKARRDGPAVEWVQGDIGCWLVEERRHYELVFSNAALQWVPRHGAVFPRLLDRVAPGGALAVQMPAGSDIPAQRLIRQMAAAPQWRARFTAPPVDWRTEPPGFYYDALAARAARLEIWETEYLHVMEGPEAILAWYSGSGLRPFLHALSTEDDRAEYLAEYLERLRPCYPAQADGRVLFPFRRLFLVAYLAS